MADDGNLRVKITGDASDLGKTIVKSKKALTSFGKSADQAGQKTKQMGRQLSTNAVPALTSFSQVVQDAPFGIQGVANNITQLTAQFGNLSTASGGAKNALKGMIASLAGPAGILLAISVVTSLLVSYGDEIKNFIFGTDAAKNATEQLNDSLRDQIGLRKQLKDELNVATSIAVAEAKLAGKNAAEQFAVRKKFSEANIKVLETEYDNSLKALKDYHDANQREIAKGSEDEVEAYEALKKDRLDTQKSLRDALAQLYLDDLNEKIRIQELDKKSASTFQGVVVSNLTSFSNELTPIISKINTTLASTIPSSEVITDKMVAWENALIMFNNNAKNIISNGIANTFAGIGDAIGGAIVNSTNVLNALGGALLAGVGAIATALGKAAIKIGVGMIAIKAAFANPATAIAAGVALVAIGSVIGKTAGITSDIGGGSSSRGGIGSTDFSSGGRNISRGGSVGSINNSQGGGRYVFEIQGTKLIGVLQNTVNRNKALGNSTGLTFD